MFSDVVYVQYDKLNVSFKKKQLGTLEHDYLNESSLLN
jgi:hypothetical protein